MKGRKPPPRPAIVALVSKAESLTMADIEAALLSLYPRTAFYPVQSFSFTAETMPEPTPYERGVLDRYQDRQRRRG